MRRHLPELERLKAGLELRALVDSLEWEGPFAPRKAAGAVPLSAGNLPEIHWEESLAPPPPPAAGAALGVPQPEGFDLLSGLGVRQQGAPPAVQQQRQQQGAGLGAVAPPALALPDLSSSVRLPAASQATLAKHALLPSVSFGSPPPDRPAPGPPQPRPLYPELAELEPPPVPAPAVAAALGGLALSSSTAEQPQQPPQLPHPQPSPYGELQLGPQEVGVSGVPRPTQPLPPDATCCAPPPPPPEQAVVPTPPRGGVAEVKRLQQIRDVHVSASLMEEFMRCVPGQRPIHPQAACCPPKLSTRAGAAARRARLVPRARQPAQPAAASALLLPPRLAVALHPGLGPALPAAGTRWATRGLTSRAAASWRGCCRPTTRCSPSPR